MELSEIELTLWSRYASHRTLENRNKIFLHYSAWAKKIASSQFILLRPDTLEWSDFVQSASLALMESIDRFDHLSSVPFEAYAYPRIRGAILNSLPKFSMMSIDFALDKMDWRQKDQLYSEGAVEGFDQFVDAVLDIALSEILVSSSFNVTTRLDGDPLRVYINSCEEEKLMALIDRLPDDMHFIVTSHYSNFLSFAQIAKQMSLSKSRVSQIHREALRKLRTLYETT